MRRAAVSAADKIPLRLTGGREEQGQRGQGLVEFAALVPVFMLLLLGMLEFGFAFDQNLTLEYATREGARVGSALANGGGKLGCDSVTPHVLSPNAATVDPQILAAVQRVLLSPGSRVKPVINVTQVKIWKADANGAPIADASGVPTAMNTWKFTGVGSGADTSDGKVDGQRIAFTLVSPQQWDACLRNNGTPVDSIGVSLTYTYVFQTPLAGILRFFGGASAGTLTMSDRTVMALNPTN